MDWTYSMYKEVKICVQNCGWKTLLGGLQHRWLNIKMDFRKTECKGELLG